MARKREDKLNKMTDGRKERNGERFIREAGEV